jgi:magnesium chelatase family protein
LAHRGVLFLDEFPEFDRNVLEALRQPLEERVITISRARGVITFPAQCILIASMNPCPCGRGKDFGCTCSAHILDSYRRKISGPIMDRLDVWVNVNKIDYDKLALRNSTAESSIDILERVKQARDKQTKRFADHNIAKCYNSEMSAQDIETCIEMEDSARSILSLSAEKFELSGRAFHRIIKVARTIADLEQSEVVKKEHILEALQYRQKIS